MTAARQQLDQPASPLQQRLQPGPVCIGMRMDSTHVWCVAAMCCVCVCLQVLDEIGVDLQAMMGAAPQRKVPAQQQPVATSDSELQDLQARLAMLRS